MAKKRGAEYTLHVTPTKTVNMLVAGRKKPRKANLHVVNQFNKLVKSGLFSGIKFSKHGEITGVETWHRKPTATELKIMREVIELSHARSGMAHPRKKRPEEKMFYRMLEHQRKAGFKWIIPGLAVEMLKKNGNPARIVDVWKNIAGPAKEAQEILSKFNTPEKTARNIQKGLRYFEALLKKQKRTELLLTQTVNKWDESITKVKLSKGQVTYETNAWIKGMPVETINITLHPDGKITGSEIQNKESHETKPTIN